MPADDSRQPVALSGNAGQVVGELLEVKLLLVAELEDGAVGMRVGEEGMEVVEEGVRGSLGLGRISMTTVEFTKRRAPTVCRNNAENSNSVFENWFNGSVIPDSKNPSPCTATARSW